MVAEIGVYIIVLAWVIHNIFRFVTKGNRWRNFEIVVFYTFAFLRLSLRIGNVLGYDLSYTPKYHDCPIEGCP